MNAYHIFSISVLIWQQVGACEYDAVFQAISTLENLLADFHEIWYVRYAIKDNANYIRFIIVHYAIKDNANLIRFIIVQSVI